MMFKKVVEDGYILGVGIVSKGGNIDESEYNRLTDILNAMPEAPDRFYYALRDSDEEWELVELPPMPEPEPTAEDKAEAFDILLGGAP